MVQRFAVLAILTAALGGDLVCGQWGPRDCVSVEARAAAPGRLSVMLPGLPTADPDRMVPTNDGAGSGWWPFTHAEWSGYWHKGKLIGRYSARAHEWNTWDGQRWGAASAPPWAQVVGHPATKCCACSKECKCACKCDCKDKGRCQANCNCTPKKVAVGPPAVVVESILIPPQEAIVENHGNDWRPGDRDRFWIKGQEISREAFQVRLIKEAEAPSGKLSDDTAKLRINVLGGSEADRKRVIDDLKQAPALAPYREKILLHEYPAAAGTFPQECGHVSTGTPTIYAQAFGGKVVHRQDDYDGPEKLALAMDKACRATSIRKADPTYDPKRDPDLRTATLPGGVSPGAAFAGLAALAALLWAMNRQAQATS